MSGATHTSSPVLKRSTSPRPPAVGEEVKRFHDTSHPGPEPYKNWNMEYNPKTSCAESVDQSFTNPCTENVTESTDCAENSPNTSPPAAYKWAQSLQCLLEDIQGVSLFKKFLEQEGQDMSCLSFWFACRGVKKIDANDRDGLVKLIKIVFSKKVKRISAISDETKEEIRQKLTSNTDVNDTIFDSAQREVEAYMMKTTYPNFLRSDLYIQHLGGWQNELSPDKERVVTPEPVEQLPTVHEDAELHIPSKIPLTKITLSQRNRSAFVSKFKPESPAGYLRSPYSSYSSYHAKYGSYLPASAQDSELQSLSSDAQTDDTMSLTDGSNVDYPMHTRTKHKKPQKMSKHINVIYNTKDRLNLGNFIPRTERLPESMKPQSQEEFHTALVKALNRVIDDRRNKEKVAEKLKNVEVSDSSRHDGASFPSASAVDPCLQNHKSNSNAVFDTGFLTGPSEENVQDILDQHISRVFEDSGQHTPASGCLSPPVSRPSGDMLEKTRVPPRGSSNNEPADFPSASYKHSQISQFTVPNSIKYRRDHDTYSTDSAMFEYKSDDNLPSNYRNQYSSAITSGSEPIDYSRRSKEHSKRYISKKFSSATDSSSSCFDSGISLACDTVPSYSKVTHWLETKRMVEQEREQHTWRNSSTSPVLSRSSSSRKTSYNSCRSGSQDAGFSQWSGAPAQFAQDFSVQGFPAPDTTSNLLEARRRLEDENRAKMRMKKPNRKSLSLNVIETATTNNPPSNDVTVIGYSYGRHAVPYLSKMPGKNITFRQFKSMLSKKGNFRYFFKTASNDFGTGVVFEEVTDDSKVLPLWEGKVFCVIESMDDNTV